MKAAKRLYATGAFEYVQPNWIDAREALVGAFPPNDRLYAYQRWHYEQISLPAAMSRITALPAQPAQRPLVAVIDDGVVLDHPDLAPQLLSAGRAFISLNSAGDQNTASGDNVARPADAPHFHGTHVAGTIAAATFDALGGAGVAPMAQILPLRVFPPDRGARFCQSPVDKKLAMNCCAPRGAAGGVWMVFGAGQSIRPRRIPGYGRACRPT